MKTAKGIIWLLCLWLLGSCASARVCERSVVYRSVDQNGDSLTLSGKVSVPQGRPAKGVILLPHYTIGADKEVPSQTTPQEAKKLRRDYVLVMPDYIGYGATRELFPPYLHGRLAAQNCVDMLLGTADILDSLQAGVTKDSIYIVGFSQGAATALWTLRLIEEKYAGRIHVKKCFAGSGPYDVQATYDDAVERNKVGMPMVVPLLVMGTSAAYGLNLRREDFFTQAMNRHLDEYIASKNHGLLWLYLHMPSHKLSSWMSADGMDKSRPETQRMYEAFGRSSLVNYPFQTATPVYVFHSRKDDVVTFRNAENLQTMFGEKPNITYDFGNYGGHLCSLFRFFREVKKEL